MENNESSPSPVTTLECDPKAIARISFSPLGAKTSASVLSSTPGGYSPLTLSVVRFDTSDAVVSGLIGWQPDEAGTVIYSEIDACGPFPIMSWDPIVRKRIWWGFTSAGRFGFVVPIKEAISRTQPPSLAQARHLPLLPRSVTLEPPSVGSSDAPVVAAAPSSKTPRSSRGSASSLRGTPRLVANAAGGGTSPGTLSHSMVLGKGHQWNFGEDGSAAAALLVDIAEDDAPPLALGATMRARDVNLFGPTPTADRHGLSAPAPKVTSSCATWETVCGEGAYSTDVCGLGASAPFGEAEWVLSRKAGVSSSGGSAAAATAASSKQQELVFPWTSAEDLLAHYFSTKPTVSAAQYAHGLAKHGTKIGYDQSQFTAVLGDHKGLFVVTPGRTASTYCADFTPLVAEGAVASLGRGSYDVAMNGQIFSSMSPSASAFERDLPRRLVLPTPGHRVKSLTTVMVRCPVPANSGALVGGSTTIWERHFTTVDVVPHQMTPEFVWANTVEVQRVIPTHANWLDPAELTAPTASSRGSKGQRKSTVGR